MLYDHGLKIYIRMQTLSLYFMTQFFFFRNQVYVGEPLVKPKKNHLDMMFEHVMHSTGHDHM